MCAGLCQTTNFSDWEQESPGGCPVIFSATEDAENIDVYTNAWTPYPSILNPAVHLFFPSLYWQFSLASPYGYANDGLLDVRLAVTRDIKNNLSYTTASNSRAPFVALGPSSCGSNTPDVLGGWCSPSTGVEARTSFDTSGVYMASGYVPSTDGTEIYFYSSGQPFTHMPNDTPKSWGTNSGIRILRLRKHGFVSIEAQMCRPMGHCPNFTTTELLVPSGCAPPTTRLVPLPMPPRASGCAFEFPNGVCPAADGWQNVSCTSMAQCQAVDPGTNLTCAGLIQCRDGYCQSTHKLGVLCNASGPFFKTVTTGGVQLKLNVETSVSGSIRVEIQRGGRHVEGMGLQASDPIKGSSLSAVATWSSGKLVSLTSLEGQKIQVVVAMSEAKLFSMELGCA